jgi:hypothetical protein
MFTPSYRFAGRNVINEDNLLKRQSQLLKNVRDHITATILKKFTQPTAQFFKKTDHYCNTLKLLLLQQPFCKLQISETFNRVATRTHTSKLSSARGVIIIDLMALIKVFAGK